MFTRLYQIVVKKLSSRKQLINILFKALMVLLPTVVLYHEISKKNNLNDIALTFWRQVDNANGWWLFGAVLLVPFNWLAEVQKWRPFIVRHEHLSQFQALNAVLAGTSLALFTPNRVGEYGARILFVRPDNQWKALMANMVGSLGQYLVLLTGGVLGAVWFAGVVLGWSEKWQFGALALALFPLTALFYYYFNIRLLIPLAIRLPLLRRWKSFTREIHFLGKIESSELASVLIWSVVRYTIYTTQYFLLLRFFGITTGFTAGYAGIATIYLLQTVVPLPALAGLLVRGSLAVFIWSHFGANEISSLSTTFVLWIINLILPALIGTFSLFSVNITKSLGYEDD